MIYGCKWYEIENQQVVGDYYREDNDDFENDEEENEDE